MSNLKNKIEIPTEQRKKSTFANDLYYDMLEIYDDKVIGYLDGNLKMTWEFKNYTGIELENAGIHSQFAKIIFLTDKKERTSNADDAHESSKKRNKTNYTDRILFCSGMFSMGKTNEFAQTVSTKLEKQYEEYRCNETNSMFTYHDLYMDEYQAYMQCVSKEDDHQQNCGCLLWDFLMMIIAIPFVVIGFVVYWLYRGCRAVWRAVWKSRKKP